MKEILIFLATILFSILSAVAHEQDIARVCREQGNSGYAGWTVKIECSEMKLSNN